MSRQTASDTIPAFVDRFSWPTIRSYLVRGFVYLAYAAAIVFFLTPVLWVISISLRPDSALFTNLQLIPTDISFEAYRTTIDAGILDWFKNTLFVTTFSIVGVLLVTTPAAYAFSRFEFRGRRTLLLTVLTFQMIAAIVIVIPLYKVMQTLDLVGSLWGLALLYIGLQIPLSLWLLKSFFDTIPKEVDKAARIDGCNRLQTLVYVLLGPVKPGLAVVAILNFVFYWSEFVLAYTMLSGTNVQTLTMGIYRFESMAMRTTNWQAIAAAAVIGMVPLILFFLALQRYFIRGLTDGAVKG